MSIAVLTQVYDEMRRLAIAGSMVAHGDFRLKKLLPTLQQLGAKSPVFARVGEAAKAVVDGEEQNSAQTLLELTTLVNAILYTQGETGIDGPLEPIETIELGGSATQAGARALKPLLEALASSGSGRLELIRDAHERGAFRDIRLVRPALEAIDDKYGEIGDFIAESVLPIYGKAIVPELREIFNVKGKVGDCRRLRLMHALDPVGTRDLVKRSLEHGPKELKIVAIECLGGAPDDLSYLIEQASAKAQDIRLAAYRALAAIDDDAAVAVLRNVVDGNDLDLAVNALQKCRSTELLKYIISAAETRLSRPRKTKGKKEAGQDIRRLISLLHCLEGRDDALSEALLLGVFAAREEWAKVKGDVASGSDLIFAVVRAMELGTAKLQRILVDKHSSLSADELPCCFRAALRALPPEKVFVIFSPYVTAKLNGKLEDRNSAAAKHVAITNVLAECYNRGSFVDDKPLTVDPRWLDVAVEIKDLGLVRQFIRPGHARTNAFLAEAFAEAFRKAKQIHDCELVACMVEAAHPAAPDAFVAVLEKFGKKADYFACGFCRHVVELPQSAIPRIEALIPVLHDKVADSLLGYLQQLREKA